MLTAGTSGNVVRLLPPLTIDEALLDEALDILAVAVTTTRSCVTESPHGAFTHARTDLGGLFGGRHDVLDAGVVVEAVRREVLAVTRVLEAAVRHLGNERECAC